MALNHDVTGSVNYTVVGSPAIVDGVASGFSNNDYIQLPAFGTTPTTFHLHTKIKNPATLTLGGICGDNNYSGSWGIQSDAIGCFTACLAIIDGGSTQYINLFAGNSTYANDIVELDLDIDLSKLLMSLKVTKEGSVIYNGSKAIPSTYTGVILPTFYPFGKNNWGVFGGSIYLDETCITIDGQPWFGKSPVEVKHINYGTSVVYTKVGSPTISNGVVSGFSQSNYLSIGNNVVDTTAIEMQVCGTLVSQTDEVAGLGYYKTASALGNLGVNYYGKLQWTFSGADITSTKSAPLNTKFYLKGVLANGVATLTYSEDGSTWEQLGTAPAANFQNFNFPMNIGTSGYGPGGFHIWDGSIDLNNTYIKVNGKLWFYRPCTNYVAKDDKLVFADSGLYLSGPVNYEVIGNPTIVDGVVTYANQVTESNYLKLSQNLILPGNEVEIVFKWNGVPNFARFFNGTDNVFTISGTGNASVVYVNGTPELILYDAGSHPYIKFYKSADGSVNTLSYSDDKVNWTSVSASNLTYANTVDNCFICWYITQGQYIDLKETYIKVNGSLWFYGKNYATQNIAPVPSGYTYGTTTTSAIGYVDMRTQEFTAAPTGATIGRYA